METLTTFDGLRLHLRHWPVGESARGTVLIVHGLGEHVGRYEGVAAALNAAGWNVSAHDQRGHGRSEGALGCISVDFSLLADLSVVVDRVRDASPLVLLGHSMGGQVAARFVAESIRHPAARWVRDVDGLVMSSPALDPGMGIVQNALLGVLGPLAPNLSLNNGLDPTWISRDPQIVRQYVNDPLVHNRVSPRLVRAIVDGGQEVLALARKWPLPTLLMWAGADRCVAPAGSAAFAKAAPPGVVTAHEFPGLFHEIFNEPEREQVLERLVQWLARF